MHLDTSGWSSDGDFTAALIGALEGLESVAFIRVEDAPASRAETGYNFLSNEIHVGFHARRVIEARRAGPVAFPWPVLRPRMDLDGLERALSRVEGIGPADYADEGMLQYLRAERIIPPYQTRGYKRVELVRIYRAAEGRSKT